jgi:type II secretory pathway component PulF
MPIFRYEAADTQGQILRGAMDAPNAQEVEMRLTERGYRSVQVAFDGTPLPVSTVPSPHQHRHASQQDTPLAPLSSPLPALPQAQKTIKVPGGVPKVQDMAAYFRQLASLANAGFTPANLFLDMGNRANHPGLREASMQIGRATSNGATISSQMVQFPSLFAPHMLGLVQAGEMGGFLPFVFEEIALGCEQDAVVREGIGFTRFLVWQSIWSVLICQGFFSCLNAVDILASLKKAGLVMVIVVIPMGLIMHLVSHLGGLWWASSTGQESHDKLLLKIPAMANLAKTRALATFTRMLRRLLLAGISAPVAYEAAARAVPNSVLRGKLLASAALVRSGNGMDAAITRAGLFDNNPINMLITGQKTGQFTEMLDQVTAFYQEEMGRATMQAKAALKRAGVILTIVSVGYVTIAIFYYCSKLMFGFTDSMNPPE